MTLDPEVVDLSKIVDTGMRMFRQKALKSGIHIDLELDESAPTIEADERKLKQVLFNLLSNAVKYTPEDGEILVRTQRVGECVQISVKDSGCGVPEDQRESIFESFFQVNQPLTKQIQGTGLGLPLVRDIAQLHGGRAWCECPDEGGSVFVVELPITLMLGTDPATLPAESPQEELVNA